MDLVDTEMQEAQTQDAPDCVLPVAVVALVQQVLHLKLVHLPLLVPVELVVHQQLFLELLPAVAVAVSQVTEA